MIVGRGRNVRKGFLLCLISSIFCFLGTGLKRVEYVAPSISANVERMSRSVETIMSPKLTNRERKAYEEEVGPEKAKRNEMYRRYLEMTETRERNTTRAKRLPDVIGIGAEKCGSGALRWMLLQHPMVLSSSPAEMHYFGSRIKKHMKYYLSHMPEATPYELVFEKTPSYFVLDGAASMAKKRIPNAKILLVLCDPVNRTFSDYVQEVKMKNIAHQTFDKLMYKHINTFSAALKSRGHDADATVDYIQKIFRRDISSHLLSTGLYYYHLNTWLKEFGSSNIHVVNGEELLVNPGAELEKVQDFLHLPKLVIKEDFVKGPTGFFCYDGPAMRKTNTSISSRLRRPKCMSKSKGRTRLDNWKQRPSEDVMRELRKFYEPYNTKLFEVLKREFHWAKSTF